MEEKNTDSDRVMIFDSHCHPQFPHYDRDRDEMIKRTLKKGVFMICVGTDLKTSQQGIELTEQYNGIWATVGIHPNEVENFEYSNCNFEKFVKHPRVIAFGEIGLDYYRTADKNTQKKQKEIFVQFLSLAYKHKKPVVIHCRDAKNGSRGESHRDLLQILELSKNIMRGGVAHSFTGNIDEARRYLDLGFHLGFNGILTFTSQYDEVVKYAPLENILLETDAPYLAPLPFRGKRNEPLYVKYIAEKIAQLKGISYNQVAEQTSKNTKNLFKI